MQTLSQRLGKETEKAERKKTHGKEKEKESKETDKIKKGKPGEKKANAVPPCKPNNNT